MNGKFVLIRTINAGVHFGTFIEYTTDDHKGVLLSNARRLWSWTGALSLSEVAMKGINISDSTIAERVDEIELTQAIEIIPVSKKSNLPGNHERITKDLSVKL
jgi:hypothetical protein